MKKIINRILKLVGLNLVRAKRKSPKWQTLERYTPDDKVPPATSATVPLADYMGDSERHNAPGPEGPTGSVGCCGIAGPLGPPDGEGVRGPSGPVSADHKTHYVGDDCPGGHRDLVGADDHKINREPHFYGCCCVKCIEQVDRPRVEQPNSDNKIGGPTS